MIYNKAHTELLQQATTNRKKGQTRKALFFISSIYVVYRPAGPFIESMDVTGPFIYNDNYWVIIQWRCMLRPKPWTLKNQMEARWPHKPAYNMQTPLENCPWFEPWLPPTVGWYPTQHHMGFLSHLQWPTPTCHPIMPTLFSSASSFF